MEWQLFVAEFEADPAVIHGGCRHRLHFSDLYNGRAAKRSGESRGNDRGNIAVVDSRFWFLAKARKSTDVILAFCGLRNIRRYLLYDVAVE